MHYQLSEIVIKNVFSATALRKEGHYWSNWFALVLFQAVEHASSVLMLYH